MQVQINHISPCRSIMRAVLSSLVLLFGSAMAIPSLLRTGQSDKNDNGSLFNYYLDDNDDDIDNNIWDGEGRGEREGQQWGGGQSVLLMMQLWGESDDERFSNQPKSKHSGGSQWSREVCKHFVRTKAKYHPRRYNLLPVFFTRYATMGGVSQWLAISSTLLYFISLTWMVKYPINIAKGTTDPRVEFISQVQTQSLIKFHLKNVDQVSTSKSQPNISLSKVWTKV